MSKIKLKKNYLKQTIFIFFTILWIIFSTILLFLNLSSLIEHFYMVILYLFIFFCFFGLIQYLFLKKLFLNLIKIKLEEEKIRNSNESKTNVDTHLFFYLLSALQDKGRFLDFISEDISSHKDINIGIVARLVHKNCKKIIENYLTLEHVIKKEEKESIILSNFDRKTIELIGNVVGEPPYNGIVRHKGWKAKPKIKNLPNFSIKLDKSKIIYPAQIEIF